MGCCKSEPRLPSEEDLLIRIKTAIESNNTERLASYLLVSENYFTSSQGPAINRSLIDLKGMRLCCLAYTVWLGHLKPFRYLYEKKCASVEEMEKDFARIETSAVTVMCQRGHIDLLNYYLPIYIEKYSGLKEINKEESIVHKLCKSGNVAMLSAVVNWVKGKENIPETLDLHFLSSENGENSALQVCRISHLVMIKFLGGICKEDFKSKNKQGEGAVELIAKSGSTNENIKLCIEFVVKHCSVEIPQDFALQHPEVYALLGNSTTETPN
jgi:hypothetical protein